MKDCIFCKIGRGELPSEKIWENSKFLSFKDIHPVGEGHTLIIPKKHFDDFIDLDKEFYEEYLGAIKKTAKILIKKYHAEGFNLVLNNGKVAGQIVNHVHFHLIPRKKGDKKQGISLG